jgi:hypothetical protein
MFSEPSPLPVERLTRSRYVVCTADRTLNPQWMRKAAEQFCDEVAEVG